MYYLHQDYLGSVCAVTDNEKNVVERHSYDAWGRPRNPQNWSYENIPDLEIIDRGYTGHQHIFYTLSDGTQGGELINMNARLYDPVLGRMLSPDNYIALPDYTQSYNRYTYAYNNPLKYTDPSGNNPAIAFMASTVIPGLIVGYGSAVFTTGEYAPWKWDASGWVAFGAGFAIAAGVGGIAYGMFGGVMPTIADFKSLYAFKPGFYVPRRFQSEFLNIMINSGFEYGDFYFEKRKLNYDCNICNKNDNDILFNQLVNTIEGDRKLTVRFNSGADKWGGGHAHINKKRSHIDITKQKIGLFILILP